MMKNIIYAVTIILSVNMLLGQELFIQQSDKLKGSVKVMGKEYVKVYDNTNHRYRYFNEGGNEIFLIKSFDEDGNEVNLSIEKNNTTESIEMIVDNNPIGFVVNSIVYDLDMVEIGRLFEGRYSQKNINDFWEGVDYSRGNIAIYDFTGLYKIGSFKYKPEIDYYAVLGVNRIDNADDLSSAALRREVRNIQRVYKKLLRQYDGKKNRDQEKESQSTTIMKSGNTSSDKLLEINKAYSVIMSDLGYDDKKEKKILGLVPQDYFEEERRSNWSENEGYVPYSKRSIEEHTPDTQIEKDELYYSNE